MGGANTNERWMRTAIADTMWSVAVVRRRNRLRGMKMKVLIADDHVLFREGVRMVFAAWVGEPVEIVEAASYDETLDLLKADPHFDLALLDLWMPGTNGVAGVESVRALCPSLPIVVVSAFEDQRDVRRVMGGGANAFIGKSSPSAQFAEGVRQVLAGNSFVSPIQRVETAKATMAALDPGQRLTQRQREVLYKLQDGKSNKEIARELGLAEITVKLHVTAILRAFNAENRTQVVVRTALGHGQQDR